MAMFGIDRRRSIELSLNALFSILALEEIVSTPPTWRSGWRDSISDRVLPG